MEQQIACLALEIDQNMFYVFYLYQPTCKYSTKYLCYIIIFCNKITYINAIAQIVCVG